MSATNRGSVRNERDLYPTPLSAFKPLLPYLQGGREHWEPACGDGRLINSMRDFGLIADGTDIDKGVDFLQDHTKRECIITNPPFSLAFEFCKHARKVSKEFFFLLPLSFLGSKERKNWFIQGNEPALFVLSKRPSFCVVVKCAKETPDEADERAKRGAKKCVWRKTLSVEAERPKQCPECGRKVDVTTSDSME